MGEPDPGASTPWVFLSFFLTHFSRHVTLLLDFCLVNIAGFLSHQVRILKPMGSIFTAVGDDSGDVSIF